MEKIEPLKKEKLTSIFDFWDSTRNLQIVQDDKLIELLEFLNEYTVLRDPQYTVFRTDNELMDIIESLIQDFYQDELSNNPKRTITKEEIYKNSIEKSPFITREFINKKSRIEKK